MSYQDDYKDVRWQMKRDGIRLRDNYTCRYCNVMGGFVNTHHLIYRSGLKPWEYPDEELLCLCEDCHKYVTDVINQARLTLTSIDNVEALRCFALFIEKYRENYPDPEDASSLNQFLTNLTLLCNSIGVPLVMRLARRLMCREFVRAQVKRVLPVLAPAGDGVGGIDW